MKYLGQAMSFIWKCFLTSENLNIFRVKKFSWNSPVAQWLAFGVFPARAQFPSLVRGTKIPQAAQHV